jgi:hypothetical protein
MIILSNSLPKTGSTLLAHYQEDILRELNIYHGQTRLVGKFGGRYIDIPTKKKLLQLFYLNLGRGSLVVKCHWRQDKLLNFALTLPHVKMTVCYRDPRDIILSMIDHGERTRKGLDPSGAFSECYEVSDLIPRAVDLMKQLEEWRSQKNVHLIRYEELVSDPAKAIEEMSTFLNLSIDSRIIEKIILKRESIKKGSHNFNKGTICRWRSEMSPQQQKECLSALKPYLVTFDYDLR